MSLMPMRSQWRPRFLLGDILVTKSRILVIENTRKQRVLTDQEQSELVALFNNLTALHNKETALYSERTAYSNQKVELLKRREQRMYQEEMKM
jgi:hypothetical protein